MAVKAILLTGFPGFIGHALLGTLLRQGRAGTVYLLVQQKFLDLARAQAGALAAENPGADLRIVVGDVTKPGLGLAPDALRAVREETGTVFHLAAIYDLAVGRDLAYAINVVGTRNVLNLCREIKHLDRLVYFSSYTVAGRRRGRLYEDELIDGGFKNHYEETKYEAEAEVRKAMDAIPTVIVRPAIVVGDSRTGATDKFDGPYFLIRFIWRMAQSGLPFDRIPLPSPYAGRAGLNLVPVDYVARAASELAVLPEAIGKTFHLCDPNPWTAREILAEACRKYGLRRPVGHVPTPLTRALFRSRRVRRFFQIPRELIDYTSWRATLDDTNSRTILGTRGIVPPPITRVLPAMLAYVRANPATPSDAKF